jgi:EAL domain-containing protein (putative c-di-GMP-specific phosphodiesterase class I)
MLRFPEMPEEHDDVFPHSAGHPGRLFLWFPVGLALKKVRRYLRQIDAVFTSMASGALVVSASHGYPVDLIGALAELLSEHEAADTRCVFKTGGDDLDGDDIRRVRTLRELRKLRESAWLVDMLRSNRLTSVFQPIVRADEPTNVFGHEALVRGIGYDGHTVSPASLFDAARGCGMLTELDCAASRSAIRAAATRDDQGQLFLNFSPEALRDGVEALAPTIVAIDEASILRERVVFEVMDAEEATDMRHLRSLVDSVRDAGFRVALDDIGCADLSRRLVHEVRPDFVKLDMQRVRRLRASHLGDAERLLDLAQQLKIETIAEGVETRQELAWNRERGARYVQGYFIARPGALSAA